MFCHSMQAQVHKTHLNYPRHVHKLVSKPLKPMLHGEKEVAQNGVPFILRLYAYVSKMHKLEERRKAKHCIVI